MASVEPAPKALSKLEAEALIGARLAGGVALAKLLADNLRKGWLAVHRTATNEFGWSVTDAGREAMRHGEKLFPEEWE